MMNYDWSRPSIFIQKVLYFVEIMLCCLERNLCNGVRRNRGAIFGGKHSL